MNCIYSTARTTILTGTLAALLSLTAACASPDNSDEMTADNPKTPAEMSREERIELRQDMAQSKNLEQVTQEESMAVTGEVPQQLLDEIMADLETRTGAPRSEFVVKRAEAVQWNDGSLGCPQPGQVYTQAIVPGYRVVIEHKGSDYDYHAAERGYFVLCENPRDRIEQIEGKKKGPLEGAPVQ